MKVVDPYKMEFTETVSSLFFHVEKVSLKYILQEGSINKFSRLKQQNL